MAQPSVAQFFRSRKRPAVEEYKINHAKKVLVLDKDAVKSSDKLHLTDAVVFSSAKNIDIPKSTQTTNRNSKKPAAVVESSSLRNVPFSSSSTNIKQQGSDINDLKKVLCRSAKLSNLKEALNKCNELSNKLNAAEKNTNSLLKSPASKNSTILRSPTSQKSLLDSPTLNNFKSIELEITSPQKVKSPEKPYLSPKKDNSARRILFGPSSPLKAAPEKSLEITKPELKLPLKYRNLVEIFRAVDTISQILYNRKEKITFSKLKSAVEQMLKKTFTTKHLAQIKKVLPTAYNLSNEKLRKYGSLRAENWELVLTLNIEDGKPMTPEVLLERRRDFLKVLIDRVKIYHKEFLHSQTPQIVIPDDELTRWHQEFNLDQVPDIELADIPEPPVEERLNTGKEVLEKARQLFNCNTRMEKALAKLQAQNSESSSKESQCDEPGPVLKGIPKALLEKVRQKQAAKALFSMTMSERDNKEEQMYLRLPEIARLLRALFVTERKGVLPLETVIDKLNNSHRHRLSKQEMEVHLKTISEKVPEWLVFHNIRKSVFLKLAKNADLSDVITKLEKLSSEKKTIST